MLDLSEEVDEENIETCVKYFTEMAKMKIWLEMEIGITGGVEDGVDNSGVSKDKLYTSSEQVGRASIHADCEPQLCGAWQSGRIGS
eukprot:5730596-Pleurochrysis_carterae.AAC.1